MKRKIVTRIARIVTSIHVALYRASKGKIGGSISGLPVLLLTTAGRKTGRRRTTPLGYLPEGEDLLIVASNGGAHWFPSWWLNLNANPAGEVQMGDRRLAVTARKASPDERKVFWPRLVAAYKGYAGYERKTTREIPVVVLTPVSR
jgi:deazaflavin-dependent oxidoreductase (nitroreductase family)